MSSFKLWNPKLFEMNPHFKQAPEYANPQTYPRVDPLSKIRQTINAFAEESNRLKKTTPWKAICLYSSIIYASDSKSFSLSKPLNKTAATIQVIARIPELDCLLPIPSVFGDPDSSEISDLDASYIRMHRVYTRRADGLDNMPLPSPGDIVEVQFEGGSHLTGVPVYLGIAERGIGLIPDKESESTEASSAFENNGDVNTMEG